MKKTLYLFFPLLLLLFGVLLFTPVSIFKEKILLEINKHSPLKIKFEKIGYQLINLERLSLEDIEISNKEKLLISIKKVELSLSFSSLLKNKIVVETLIIDNPNIGITSKSFEVIPSKQKTEPNTVDNSDENKFNSLFIKKIILNNINAKIDDLKIQNLKVIFTNLMINNFSNLKSLNIEKLKLELESITKEQHTIEKLNLEASLSSQVIHIKEINGRFWDHTFSGEIIHPLSNSDKPSEISLQLSQFDLSKLNKLSQFEEYPLEGKIDISLNTNFNSKKIFQTNGILHIKGQHIQVKNIDIDKLINNYKDSQKVTVLDALGFYALGPIGILYSQGVNIGTSIPGVYGGKSTIEKLEIELNLNNQSVALKDVAIKTQDNFIAVKGEINLATKELHGVKVGFLNRKRCADLVQKIKGTYLKPEFEVGKSILKTVVAPVTSLLKSSEELLSGGCEKFYHGKL